MIVNQLEMNYRQYLKAKIQENAQVKGYKADLARGAGCQPSYLSQVLAGDHDLTLDQAAGMTAYWKLDSCNSEYFLTLVMLGRATSPYLKKMLEDKLNALQRDIPNSVTMVTDELKAPAYLAAKFFSNWYASAIHTALSLEGCGTVNGLSKRLGLSQREVEANLTLLHEMGLIENVEGVWVHKVHSFHFRGDFEKVFHTSLLNKSIASMQDDEPNNTYQSFVLALSKKNLKELQSLISDFVKAISEIGSKEHEQEEEIVGMSLNLFKF
jgi:uncharacterized protein (TIGR02147 family)